MKYEYAFDLQRIAEDVCNLMFPHVKIDRIKCFRSYGSSTKRTVARCHALGKLMQKAMAVDAFYSIEFLMPIFEKQSKAEQIKTIIHELMHIPKTFGGGFRHHDFVTEENVNILYQKYMEMKRNENII
ncbi:MAG: putative metallopeptidase [Patescibacteria group bacterium]|nr:putative metallopeptidase [Patescibacteria group bacterium]